MPVQPLSDKKPLVELDGLEKHYESRSTFGRKHHIRAVNGFSLSIHQGETVGLVGESGCGKSTVGQMAARLIEPSGGRLLLKGENTADAPNALRKTLRQQIQYVFQDPLSSLNPKFQIGRLLEEPLRLNQLYKKQERKLRVLDMLERIGLDASYVNRYPHELSGGQRQRIGIARALMLNPAFLVLDEPVSALDVSVQAQILNLLKELQQELALTYLFISHDMNVVHYMSDRVAVMYLGEIVEYAEVEELYNNPLHPYTQALVSAISVSDHTAVRERIILKGELPNPQDLLEGCPFQTRCLHVHDRCRREAPQLTDVQAGHKVSCHLYQPSLKE